MFDPSSFTAHPLQIVACRHWLVAMPFREALQWGSGARPAATRLLVEITLANGVKGYGETICLLEFIEPVLVKTIFPIALMHTVMDIERMTRHVLGAGYYHHKRAAVMAMAALEMAMWDARDRAVAGAVAERAAGHHAVAAIDHMAAQTCDGALRCPRQRAAIGWARPASGLGEAGAFWR
jgi:glucarate dehydratase